MLETLSLYELSVAIKKTVFIPEWPLLCGLPYVRAVSYNKMPYKVKLDAFEGPLDLLLFLIKKNEVDIYDIPIADITQQFLDYIEIIQLLDLEAASDFVLMAATLMRIKAQMLLPKPEAEEVEELEDPRQELVYRLLEYKRFKDVAVDLGDKEQQARLTFSRGSRIYDKSDYPLQDYGADVTLFDLVAAFRKVVAVRSKISVHRIEESDITVEEQMDVVLNKVRKKGKVEFMELFDSYSKAELIVTFIALLELIKQRFIKAVQQEVFGQIILTKADG